MPPWISVWFRGCAVGKWRINLENGALLVRRPDGGRCPASLVFDENTESDAKQWLRGLVAPCAEVEVCRG